MIVKKEITYTLLCPICYEGCAHCGDGSVESQLVFVETSLFLENSISGREDHAMGCPVCKTKFVIDDYEYEKMKRRQKTSYKSDGAFIIKKLAIEEGE